MEEQIYLLIAKSLNGETTPAEQQELEHWLQESEDNRTALKDMEGLWQDADTLLEQPKFDTDAAWDKVAAATAGETIEMPAPKTTSFRKWITISSAAAAVAAILLVYIFYIKTDVLSVTATANSMALELPDHSKVRLQAGSTLTYPERFSNKERHVSIQGEAFFEVTPNPAQPFTIDAGTVDVRVLGTSFYVTTSGDAATVAVTTGKVSMTAREHHQKIILTPGHKGVYSNNTLSSVTDTNAVYYREGVLNLTGLSLSDALATIGKVKNINIAAPDLDAAKLQQQVTISFQYHTAEKMLDELCLITATRWKKDKEQYLIYDR